MSDVGKMFQVPEGTTVLQEGELSLDMYKIVQGYAEVYVGYGTDRETLIGLIGPQSCFGEFGLLLEKPAIYTVIAYSDLLLLRITKGEMGDFVTENHKIIIDIMQNMAKTMMIMHSQMDRLVEEIKSGIQPDPQTINDIRKTFGNYTVYRNKAMSGKFHTLDMIRDKR